MRFSALDRFDWPPDGLILVPFVGVAFDLDAYPGEPFFTVLS